MESGVDELRQSTLCYLKSRENAKVDDPSYGLGGKTRLLLKIPGKREKIREIRSSISEKKVATSQGTECVAAVVSRENGKI